MNKNRLDSRFPRAWRGNARPAAIAAGLVALMAFVMIVPTAWTAIARPTAAAQTAGGEACKARTVSVHAAPAEVATNAQFMQWAMAAHRSAAGASSFTALAAARTLSQDNHN